MKRKIALILALVFTVGNLAGCGAEKKTMEENVESNSNENFREGGYIDYSNGFPERVTIEIPVYDRAFEGWNPVDNYYTQWIQREFGDTYNVEIKFVSVGRSTEVQDYMQMIAAGNAPDIIMHYNMPQAVNYYSEGAIQPLDLNELAFYAPYYFEKMKDTVETYGKVDGENIFFFAARNAIYYNVAILIRQDWLDKVEMGIPKNLAELEKVGLAWKDAGLGKIGATLGSYAAIGGLVVKDFLYEYPYLREEQKNEFPLYLDLDVAPFVWKPTKDYLAAQNRMYNAGILDPEFYLNKEENDTKADFVSGNTGIFRFTLSSNTDVFDALLANDPEARLSVLDPAALSPDGRAYYYKYPPYGLIMGINNQTTDMERAAIWMYLNWLCQPENLFYIQNGVEGETYNLDENGIAVAVEDYKGEAKLSNNMNKDYWCLVQEVVDYGNEEKNFQSNLLRSAPKGFEYIVKDNYEIDQKNKKEGIVSPVFTKSVESISEYKADLSAMWQQFYVDCVTCKPEEFEEKYENYCIEYLEAGYQEIIDEKQNLLDEGAFITETE